jgi:hypothetical protein
MAGGDAVLASMIDRIRSLGELPEVVAPEVATELKRVTDANIARGVGPDGTPWELTADGKVPLRGAAAAVTARAIGTMVLMRVDGPEARHNNATAKGRIRRRILPTPQLSAPIVAAIRRVCGKRFARAMGAGGG